MVNEVANSQMSLATRRGASAALPASPKSLEAYPSSSVPERARDRQAPTASANITGLVEAVNERPQVQNRSLRFSVHQGTGIVQVRVYNTETNELIREIPSEEMLQVAERIDEALSEQLSGIVLQDKA